MNLPLDSYDYDRNSAIFQESYVPHPDIAHPFGHSPFANYERIPWKQPVGKGLGVCSKGVLKQPQKFVTLVQFMNSHSHHHTCQPLVSKSYLNLCKCVKKTVAFEEWQKQMFYPPWT